MESLARLSSRRGTKSKRSRREQVEGVRGSDVDDVVRVECVSLGAQRVRLRSQPAIDPRLGVEREDDLRSLSTNGHPGQTRHTHKKPFLSSLSNVKQMYYCFL